MKEKGFIHIYCGDGKGKTTCGMGLCCRAAGAGLNVLIYQYMKDGCAHERKILEAAPNVTFAGEKRDIRFSFLMSREEKQLEKERYRQETAQVFDTARKKGVDVLFLDEVLYAVSTGLLEEQVLTDLLDQKPEGLEVILTGREASEAVLSRADYISRIGKEKHPFEKGIPAREGIEF